MAEVHPFDREGTVAQDEEEAALSERMPSTGEGGGPGGEGDGGGGEGQEGREDGRTLVDRGEGMGPQAFEPVRISRVKAVSEEYDKGMVP